MRGHEPALPKPFDIPSNFPQAILLGLSNKKLTGKPRTKFITIIAQTIYRFKNYPTEDEYIQVVQELVKKWPFLDDGKGIVSIISLRDMFLMLFLQRYLIVALRMRMAYLRKPGDMKRGNPSKDKRRIQPKDKARMPSAPTVSPLPCGEDKASLQRHCQMLKAEMKKVTPNKQVLQKLMLKTYVPRRKDILEGMGTVQDHIQLLNILMK